jgi:hypothetical protein
MRSRANTAFELMWVPPLRVAYRLVRMFEAGHLISLADDVTGFAPDRPVDDRTYLVLSAHLVRLRVVPYVEGASAGVVVPAAVFGSGVAEGAFVPWSTTVRRHDVAAVPLGRLPEDLFHTVARLFASGRPT